MRTLSINFYAEKITDEKKQELMTAVEHEKCAMLIQMAEADISRLNTQIANLEKNEDMSEDKRRLNLMTLTRNLRMLSRKSLTLKHLRKKLLRFITRYLPH